MALSPRCIWYLVLIGIDIFSFIVILLTFKLRFLFIFQIYLAVASFVYFAYMLIIELAASGQKTESTEQLVNEKNSSFMANHFFKYLFCSIIGIIFISGFFDFTIGNSFFHKLSYYGLVYLLPVACFLEIYFKERERKPNLILDLTIIIIILGLKLLCKFLDLGIKAILEGILESIINFVTMIFAYILYDILVYLKINGTFNGYTIKGLYEIAKQNSEKSPEGA